jgi:hypothetical protein
VLPACGASIRSPFQQHNTTPALHVARTHAMQRRRASCPSDSFPLVAAAHGCCFGTLLPSSCRIGTHTHTQVHVTCTVCRCARRRSVTMTACLVCWLSRAMPCVLTVMPLVMCMGCLVGPCSYKSHPPVAAVKRRCQEKRVTPRARRRLAVRIISPSPSTTHHHPQHHIRQPGRLPPPCRTAPHTQPGQQHRVYACLPGPCPWKHPLFTGAQAGAENFPKPLCLRHLMHVRCCTALLLRHTDRLHDELQDGAAAVRVRGSAGHRCVFEGCRARVCGPRSCPAAPAQWHVSARCCSKRAAAARRRGAWMCVGHAARPHWLPGMRWSFISDHQQQQQQQQQQLGPQPRQAAVC